MRTHTKKGTAVAKATPEKLVKSGKGKEKLKSPRSSNKSPQLLPKEVHTPNTWTSKESCSIAQSKLRSSSVSPNDDKLATKNRGKFHTLQCFACGFCKLHAQHESLETSSREGQVHCQFMDGKIIEVKKRKRFTLFPKPPHANNDSTIHVFGMCVVCRESLKATYVVGSFMLECRHQYYPLCFSAILHTRGVCVKEGCNTVILAMATSMDQRTIYCKG
ncbi:hypothetical protein L7F22_068933 [Adiantum nelumboides]|nr:hypothetical protein [Adiantum nelumboides]